MLDAFERATQARGDVQHRIRFHRHDILLRFAGGELTGPLTRAFGHLERGGERPALTIHVWDTASTGIEVPPLPERFAKRETEVARGIQSVYGFLSERIHVCF